MGRAVEARRLGVRGGAIAWHAAKVLTIDLARARISIARGQFLAPRVPVVIQQIEPIARYCAGVARRSLIRARGPRSDLR